MNWLDRRPDDLLKQWLRSTQAPMIACEVDGTILWANQAFEQLLGYSVAELVGMNRQAMTIEDAEVEADQKMAASTVAGEEYLKASEFVPLMTGGLPVLSVTEFQALTPVEVDPV